MKPPICLLFLVCLLILAGCAGGAAAGPVATPAPGAASYIQNKGSDTLVNVALAWAERYQQIHPNVRISVTGGGSGTGLAALVNKTVDIANASRKINADEIAAAKKNGADPVEFVVARDAIGVIVNPKNPINNLTMQQISDIYTGRISNWQDLGGENRPIVRLSRETNSGTHVYFLESVIRLGNSKNKDIFSADTLLLPSSEGIISEVRDNPNAIGYDGLGYITAEVKVIGIAPASGKPAILPSVETVNSGQYPIARDLYMYTPGQPSGAVKDYLNWVITPEAQAIVRQLGFVPIK
jgi:phosphate transport system substrate-binding protein